MAQLFTFGAGKTHSFYALQSECPIEDSTARSLDDFFGIESPPQRPAFGEGADMHQHSPLEFDEASHHISDMSRGSGEYGHHQDFGFEMNHASSLDHPRTEGEEYGYSEYDGNADQRHPLFFDAPYRHDFSTNANSGMDMPFFHGGDHGAYMYAPPDSNNDPYSRSCGIQPDDDGHRQFYPSEMGASDRFTFGGGDYSATFTEADYQTEHDHDVFLSEQRPTDMESHQRSVYQNTLRQHPKQGYARSGSSFAW